MGRVVVVGSLNVDRPWRVERHPAVGETVSGRSLVALPGGKGLNLAVAARRMAVDVALVGAVGDDPDGRWLRRVATDEDIDTAGVVTVRNHATGCALIVIDDAGANTVMVDPGANATIVAPALRLDGADVVIAPLEVPDEAIGAAFAQARAVGARTILNPSPVAEVEHLLAHTDVVVVNEHEAAALAGRSVSEVQADPTTIAAALAAPGQMVVVTLGRDGVAAGGDAIGALRIRGVGVTPVDTTGAGDCFGGVFAAALAEGLTVPAALDRANRAAALAVTRLGTVAAMPTRAEVLATPIPDT
jgi:ribokinase